MNPVALPTLRRKILRSFLVIVILYGILGVFLVAAVVIASGTTPKLLHVNYDSIQAGIQMKDSWSALRHPEDRTARADAEWRAQFEQSLTFEENNITEPGEKEIAQGLRQIWDRYKQGASAISPEMNRLLDQLIAVNEKGMFGHAQSNEQMSHRILLASIIYFLLSLGFSIYLADNLAERLSRPIKSIAEALHRRPAFGKRLKLGEPRSLEILILNTELTALWSRASESQLVNVREIVQQRNSLETVLKSVEDALLVVDEKGIVTHCNECMQSLIGLAPGAIVGHAWHDLSTLNENYLKLRQILGAELANSQEVELLLSGTKRYYSARTRPILDSEHRPVAALYLLHDLTEKRQREKFRSEFIDLLSHEIKTPLQSLGTAAENLKHERSALSEGALSMVETILEDVERIRAVANEFVQVTQSQSKIMKLKLQSVAVNQLLPEWLKPFQVVAKDRKVRLNFEQAGSSVIWASLDAVKFPWVISNLVSNAIRFSPEGGEVRVGLTDRNGSVEIFVLDEGSGVSVEDQRRIFEPFFQGAQGLMATPSGMRGLFGVGLTIAKEVVEAHDGRIEYYARKPTGSEFRIVLPFPAQNYG
jgi:two-component system, NtrC family, sensor histidine kinase KinB